jgi:carboxylate-amine ligase
MAAAGQGVRVAALATSPTPVSPTPTYDERYLQMMVDYAATAREQLTCGCHVHVGIESRAEGIAALNGIQPWLSCILAISTNSPFWQGLDTGYASYRRMVWDRWPSAGPTVGFADPDEYDATVTALMNANVLLDRGMVYFDARLSAHYPTVEIRVADVGLAPDSALVVAALGRALVDSAASGDGDWPVARVELLRGAAWRAARSGLTGDLIDPVNGQSLAAQSRLQQLVDRVTPSLRRHGDLALVEAALEELLRTGTGAELQRAAYATRNDLADVVADAVDRVSP